MLICSGKGHLQHPKHYEQHHLRLADRQLVKRALILDVPQGATEHGMMQPKLS